MFYFVFTLLVYLLQAPGVNSDCISTVGGTGTVGYNGDGMSATSAQLSQPTGIAVDGLGRMVIADYNNNRIRRIDANGTITTIAGTGTAGYNGDGMLATSSQLNNPYATTIDSLGRVLIADYNNHRVRRIELNGTIRTIAGTGSAGYNGEAMSATSAQLNAPRGVAVDPLGRVFIAEYGNHRVRRIDVNGTIITLAGTGIIGSSGDGLAGTNARLNFPIGVAVDNLGRVVIGDYNNNRVRRIDTTGIISTIAGTGTGGYNGDGISATGAQVYNPYGVAVDALGRVFIADYNNHRIRQIDGNGVITTVAGTGNAGFNGDGIAATSAQVNAPRGVAVDSLGRVLIADLANARLRVVDVVCIVQIIAVNMWLLPPSLLRVAISTNRAGSASSVTLNSNACSSVLYANGYISAVCPLPPRATATLSVVLAATTTATVVLAINASSAMLSPCNQGVEWGSKLTLVLVPAIAANVSSLFLANNGISVPCTNLQVLNDSALDCVVQMPLEAGFSQPLDVLITYSEGSTSTVPAFSSNITFIRPRLSYFYPVIVDGNGGDVVLVTLPQPVPNIAMCTSARGWLGSAPSMSCQLLNASAVSCVAPPGGSTFVRITIELCGLFNVTSDGLAPTAAVEPLIVGVDAFISYNPSSLFVSAMSSGPAVLLRRPTSNLTIYGDNLGALSTIVTGISLAGSSCVSFRIYENRVLCVDWPYDPSAGSPVGIASVVLSVTLVMRRQAVSIAPLLRAMHEPQLFSVSPTIAAAGSQVIILGTFFLVNVGAAPNFTVGDLPCAAVSSVSDSSVQCTLPSSISSSIPGFPLLPIIAKTAAGSSTDTIGLTISVPASASFGWPAQPAPVSVLSSAAHAVIPISPAPNMTVTGDSSTTCSLVITSWICPEPFFQLHLPYVKPVPDATLVGITAQTVIASPLTPTVITFANVGVRGAAGCVTNVSAQCMDSSFRSFSPLQPLNVASTFYSVDWVTSSYSHYFAPMQILPPLICVFDVESSEEPATVPHALYETLLSCTAVLTSASVTILPGIPLSQVIGGLSTASVSVSTASAMQATINLTSLATTFCNLGGSYLVQAECLWAPTGERVRLPALPLSIVDVGIKWIELPGSATALAYTPMSFSFTFHSTSADTEFPASVPCGWRTSNVSNFALTFVATNFVVAASSFGSTITVTVTLQGPPAASLEATVQCTFWGQLVTSPPLQLRTTGLAIRNVTVLPTSFIPSDSSQPWPVAAEGAPLAVQVVDDSGAAVLDVWCSLTTVTPRVSLVALAGEDAAAVFAVIAADHSGTILLPPFGITTQFGGPFVVALRIACQRPTGDAAPPLVFNVSVIQLHAVACGIADAHTTSQTALPAFAIAIVMEGEDQGAACDLHSGSVRQFFLPEIGCSVVQTKSASSANSSVFLQGSTAVLDARLHVASFASFVVTAAPGFSYLLSLSCSIGGVAIPPAHTFTVELTGCAAGTQLSGVFCQKCAGDQFSLGSAASMELTTGSTTSTSVLGTCQTCPAAGATCSNGILSLLPNYYQSPSQRELPFGPSSALFACPIAGACLVNASSLSYSCALGYMGPLCGVCDSALGYAQFGVACGPCWPVEASIALLVLLFATIAAMLVRVALRTTDGTKSDASIALKILLGYLQAVGSLRAFKAGGTSAYHSVMGWTDTVSANPFSFGAMQCLLRPSFLTQYLATVLLPFMASCAVIIIFFAVVTVRALRCTVHGPGFHKQTCVVTMRKWLKERRHFATLLFVLFLTYMSIISSSLKVLDCSDPIDRKTYLRADLRVECYEGEHIVGSMVAYCTLMLLGIGFPVGLYYLLARVPAARLADPQFQSTFGFLYSGYRVVDESNKGGVTGRSKEVVSVHSRNAGCCVPSFNCSRPSGEHLMWWESVVLLRKAGIVLLAVLVSNPYYQSASAALWLILFLQLQTQMRPYSKQLFNTLETMGLASAIATAIVSSLLLQYNVADPSFAKENAVAMTNDEWGITIMLAVVNITTLCVMAGMWVRLHWQRAHAMVHLLTQLPSSRGSRTVPQTISYDPYPAFQSSRIRFALSRTLPVSTAPVAGADKTCDVGHVDVDHINPLLLLSSGHNGSPTPSVTIHSEGYTQAAVRNVFPSLAADATTSAAAFSPISASRNQTSRSRHVLNK